MPFKNYSLTKGGQLTIGQIMSPDFVHGISGWSINKDGSAEFHDIIIPAGSGGTVVTFAASAPSGPNVGDVWYDTAAGLLASQWNGAAWVPYSIAAGAIAAGDTQNPNPFFAGGDVSNWDQTSGVASLAGVPTSGIAYPFAAEVTVSPGAAYPGIIGTFFAANPGDPVQVNGWFQSNADLQFGIEYYDSSFTFLGIDKVIVPAGAWQYAQIAGTVTAGATQAVLAVLVNNGSTTGSEVFDATALNVLTKIQGGLIEAGTLTPVFFYSGGALLMSVAAAGGTDPVTSTAYQAGAFVYGPAGSFIGMLDNGSFAELQMLPPGPVIHETAHPAILSEALNAGAVNEQMVAVFTSGKESGNDDAAIQLFSASADNTGNAEVVFEFGGAIAATLSKAGGLLLNGIAAPGASTNDAAVYASSIGSLQVIDGTDAQAYQTQRRTLVSAGASITSSLVTVFSSTTGARTYRVHGKVFFNLSNAATITAKVNGPASGNIGFSCIRSTSVFIGFDLTAFSSSTVISGSVAAASGYIMDIDGTVVVTGSATLQVQFSVSAGTMTVLSGSFLDVMPA